MITPKALLREFVPGFNEQTIVIEQLPKDTMIKLIYRNLTAGTLNHEYAADIALVVYAHSFQELYSLLPKKLVPYLASLDVFAELATDETAHKYIKAIRMALMLARNPRTFRQSLCARANHYHIPVPAHLFTDWKEESYTRVCTFRIPSILREEVKIRAKAKDIPMADYIRDSIYEKMDREDKL
jgi:hypothetical protein